MMKVMSVIMVGLMVVVHAEEGKASEVKESNTSDFELLCDVVRAIDRLWNTANDYDNLCGEDEINELGKKIEETFFGKRGDEVYVGTWSLPEKFAGSSPKRKDICGSNGSSNGMPSAEKSMATAFLCLCTGNKSFCGLVNSVEENWPSGGSLQDIPKVFKDVWGDHDEGGVMEKCKGGFSKTIKEAKTNLTASITALESALTNGTGILGKSGKDCDESIACANVTKEPTWLKQLKEISKLTLNPLPPKQQIPNHGTTSSTEPKTFLTPALEQSSPHVSTPAPTILSASSQSREEAHKKEPQKDPEEKQNTVPIPERENKPTDTHQTREEEYSVEKTNETSGSPITSPKWPLLAALLC